jgi:hypothetical protein
MLERKLAHVTIRGGIAGYAAASLGVARTGSKLPSAAINWKRTLLNATGFPFTHTSPIMSI